VAACARAGIKIVGSRHEQGCAYAADGYARATGRTGVALTTTGPGAANTLGAVGEAWASHSPVVVIASDIATTLRTPGVYRGVLHECVDQGSLFGPVTKARIVVGRADGLRDAVAEALAIATRAPSGAGVPRRPTDLLAASMPDVALERAAHLDGSRACASARHRARAPDARTFEPALDLDRRRHARRGCRNRCAGPRPRSARDRHVPGARRVTGSHPLLVGGPPHEPRLRGSSRPPTSCSWWAATSTT